MSRLALLLFLLLPASAQALSLRLAWDAAVPQAGERTPEGYVLTRNGALVQRTVETSATDALPGPGTYTYTVQAVAGADRSAPSAPLTLTAAALPCTLVQTAAQLSLTCATVPPPPVVPPGPYPLRPVGSVTASADSAETVGEPGQAARAVDGLASTLWHTEWSQRSPPLPHTLTLDLGAVLWVEGLRYQPRQDASPNGTIVQYRIETTLDGQTWTVASTGTWAGDSSAKQTRFAAVQARSVRLVGLASVNNGPWASAAEVGVYATQGGTP